MKKKYYSLLFATLMALPIEVFAEETSAKEEKQPSQTDMLREKAFQQLLDKAIPLTPEQIKRMRALQDESQQAVAATPKAPPMPKSSTMVVDLSPGAESPVIRLSAGFVSSLVFLDNTGQPWPVADYSLGNARAFDIQWDKKTSTLFIQSLKTYATGNMAIRLAELDTPVMLSFVTGQKEVDYRVDLQVKGRGPNALPVTKNEAMMAGGTPHLLNVLDGVPPKGSTEMILSDGDGRAWLTSDGKLLFRTKLRVLSPAWISSVSSPDGTHVYEMRQTPLILAIRHGQTIQIHLKGM